MLDVQLLTPKINIVEVISSICVRYADVITFLLFVETIHIVTSCICYCLIHSTESSNRVLTFSLHCSERDRKFLCVSILFSVASVSEKHKLFIVAYSKCLMGYILLLHFVSFFFISFSFFFFLFFFHLLLLPFIFFIFFQPLMIHY